MAEAFAIVSHNPVTQTSKFSSVIRLVAKTRVDVIASGSPAIDM
jgi:hypothetical protein